MGEEMRLVWLVSLLSAILSTFFHRWKDGPELEVYHVIGWDGGVSIILLKPARRVW